jgi:hypothetical protein
VRRRRKKGEKEKKFKTKIKHMLGLFVCGFLGVILVQSCDIHDPTAQPFIPVLVTRLSASKNNCALSSSLRELDITIGITGLCKYVWKKLFLPCLCNFHDLATKPCSWLANISVVVVVLSKFVDPQRTRRWVIDIHSCQRISQTPAQECSQQSLPTGLFPSFKFFFSIFNFYGVRVCWQVE